MNNIFFKRLLMIAVAAFVFGCTAKENNLGPDVTDNAGGPPVPTDSVYIFRSGTEGYFCFRIPAILKAPDGTLLAFAEARKTSCADEGNIDLVLKRSTDNGKTWGPLIMVWDDGNNTCGNPAPVVDERTGKIILLMTWNLGSDDIGSIGAGTSTDTRRVFVTSSSDNGSNWEQPREITSSVKREGWGWYATGPCHGLQIKSGAHAGRLVIPCDYIEVGPGRRGYSHVIYSDDGGVNWVIGGVSPNDRANESTVAELSDTRLMLNMRATGGSARLVATSGNGGESWENMRPDPALIEPVCQGSLLNYRVNNIHTLFFSNPASTTRTNMTIKMSTDDGTSWPRFYRVHPGPSAYSDIVMTTDNTIGILYEGGTTSPYQGIAFRDIPVADFK